MLECIYQVTTTELSYMRFFVFATFFGIFSTNALAQGFFIPQGAMAPATEKLRPLDDLLQKRAASYSQRLYQVRDGRVIAIEDEKAVLDFCKKQKLWNQ